MALTAKAGFEQFFASINLAGDHRASASVRRDAIVAELRKSFTVVDAFATGSIPKFTALSGSADIDVMVVLHYDKHIKGKTPTQVLASVRSALANWRTGARRNGQAVTLRYATWPNADVVPVYFTQASSGGVLHYNVPDSNTDVWIPSRPKELAATIEAKSTECGPVFRKLIKMMKHWNRGHGDYLTSYHIEVLAIQIFSGLLTDVTWEMFQFFEKAKGLVSTALFYDLGYADTNLDFAGRQEVLKRLSTAIDTSRSAWYSTSGTRSDDREAIRLWRQVFGNAFPEYG